MAEFYIGPGRENVKYLYFNLAFYPKDLVIYKYSHGKNGGDIYRSVVDNNAEFVKVLIKKINNGSYIDVDIKRIKFKLYSI